MRRVTRTGKGKNALEKGLEVMHEMRRTTELLDFVEPAL